MLIRCPECDQQVSDKATSCPHCGYPILQEPNCKRKSNKRMRLPNGFGQISEIKNQRLNKPFRAMVTVGKREDGKPICALLKPQSYFKTYNEAYVALVEYNRNPYDLATSSMTMKDLYEKWSEEHFKTYSNNSGISSVETAWRYCTEIYNTPIREMKTKQLSYLMDHAVNEQGKDASASTKVRIKSLMNMLFDYAVQYELVEKNFSKMFKLPSTIHKEVKQQYHGHIAYTDEEMKILWNNADKYPYVDLVLIQCYTGLRPQELCSIKRSNVDLKNGFITAGMKTEAGCNRLIPIHSRIYPFIEQKMALSEAQGLENLVICEDLGYKKGFRYVNMNYDRYMFRFNSQIIPLGINPDHRLHDARKQFISMAKKAGVDEYAIKLIVGHAIKDITESVYTERSPEWLKTEIEKII